VNDLGFIVLSYGLVLGSMAVFAWRTVRRGSALARRLPDTDKPWA
jgi:hypothetical protein